MRILNSLLSLQPSPSLKSYIHIREWEKEARTFHGKLLYLSTSGLTSVLKRTIGRIKNNYFLGFWDGYIWKLQSFPPVTCLVELSLRSFLILLDLQLQWIPPPWYIQYYQSMPCHTIAISGMLNILSHLSSLILQPFICLLLLKQTWLQQGVLTRYEAST